MRFQDRFINESDLEEFISILDRNGSIVDFQTELINGNALRYLYISADRYYDEKEKSTSIYFVIRDVTGQRKLQEETIKKEKLESAMALIVTANHEINNPLAGIILNIDLIRSILDEKKDEAALKYVGDIALDAYKISSILEKLRAIDSIKETKYADNVSMIDICESSPKNKD